MGSKTGQQEVRHGELGPLERPGAVDGSYHARGALVLCCQGVKPPAKQLAVLGRGIAKAGGHDPSRDPSDGAKLGERGGS